MKPIRVNVDFEEVLQGKPSRPNLRASVEFLVLWLESCTLLASRPYSSDYLDYVAYHSGLSPRIVKDGVAEDWWGDLSSPERMKKLSSKVEFAKWWQPRWPLAATVCQTWDELEKAIGDGTWLAKKSDGMSGRGHIRLTRNELPQLRQKLEEALTHGLVVEPLFDRTRDVSALWIPEEKRYVFYRNEIDHRFQWRGTFLSKTALESVPENTGNWANHLDDLQRHVASAGYEGPFSVDAFFYRSNGVEIFHPGSEMNPRKTMGWISYELWKKNHAPYAGLSLIPHVLAGEEWTEISEQDHALLLSPEGSPFVWYWIEADTQEEWQSKRDAFIRALPEVPNRDKA